MLHGLFGVRAAGGIGRGDLAPMRRDWSISKVGASRRKWVQAPRTEPVPVFAVCGRSANTDLCGGRSVMAVPNAILVVIKSTKLNPFRVPRVDSDRYPVTVHIWGLAYFCRDKVRIRQIAQTVHSSFGRENCPCPPHVARVAGNDREIERRVTKPQRRKEEGKAKSDLRFWYSWRPRVLASWR